MEPVQPDKDNNGKGFDKKTDLDGGESGVSAVFRRCFKGIPSFPAACPAFLVLAMSVFMFALLCGKENSCNTPHANPKLPGTSARAIGGWF